MTAPLLEVRDLQVTFRTPHGPVPVIDGLSFDVAPRAALAVLGESGSGKSVTAKAVMGLLPKSAARVTRGEILLDGVDLLKLGKGMRKVRGARISMVFQDALTSLNPVVPVGTQIAEMYRIHRGTNRADARAQAVEMMRRVRIPDAARRAGDYPFQFSGGMRQRVMIAMAIALDPQLLIADEPTTALDVTVQAQILDLLRELREEQGMALMLITHDIGVASTVTDDALVMYAGRLAEVAPTAQLMDRPAHPYTLGLVGSIPGPEHAGGDLPTIPGLPPQPANRPTGCAFHPRCRFATQECRTVPPATERTDLGGAVACIHWEEVVADDRAAARA